MSRDPADLLAPRILLVDDERQIHASVRLRLGRDYAIVCCLDPRHALQAIARESFDLCIADIHMPGMDGFSFIEAARKSDPALGYVIFSAFDSDHNLRRSIPLQVCDFITKPLPERSGFEHRMPEWIEATRQRRRELSLVEKADAIAQDLNVARLEREVELVASETARDALTQAAGLLTTIHAHLVAIKSAVADRAKSDPALAFWFRNLEEARKSADAAVAITAAFFDSAYANRDSSLALVNSGLQHAIAIALRNTRADESRKVVDCAAFEHEKSVPALSGIDFLLMMSSAIGAALTLAAVDTTVRVELGSVSRLDALLRDPRTRSLRWFNRRHASASHSAIVVTIAASARALVPSEAEAWLRGESSPLTGIPARSIVSGVQKCRGLLGLGCTPESDAFRLLLAFPQP
jgi:CheY-like chemotaxis protein